MTVSVSFLGVRGSFPCGDADKIAFGGNTACVEIRYKDALFFIDAGSGINCLAKKINNDNIKNVYGFISHMHWDHVSGLPSFLLGLNANVNLQVYAGCSDSSNNLSLKSVVSKMMTSPFFPVPMSSARADIVLTDFNTGDCFSVNNDSVHVKTAPLNHPNGATGYRLTFKDKIIAYISDTEHFPDKEDENVVSLLKDADFVIYDASYTDEEYSRFVGFGHSTCEKAVELAQKYNVKKLALFHHSPEHTDSFLRQKEEELQKSFPEVFYAREKTTFIF